jgi:hypothetical protein
MGDVDRRLAAELHHHPIGIGRLDHVRDLLGGDRLEEQPIGGVVVRRDRLGVVVDHVRLDARSTDRLHRMDRAVVELDALADADGPAADDHHALGVPLDAQLTRGGRPSYRPRSNSDCREE